MDPATTRALSEILATGLDRWPVPTAAAVVVDATGELAAHGPVDEPMPLASLSKPMAAWATLVAVEEGVVVLDDPVGPPGCTLRHLLAHASGLPFEGDAPTERPATVRIYSNTGYDLIAHHVAAAAGIPFAEYLHEAVFEPLGMSASRLDGLVGA